jgi:polysaccharide export outer membrane protein
MLSLLVASSLALGGCELLPRNGPAGEAVWGGQRDPQSLPYALVRVTPKVTTVLARAAPRLTSFFRNRARPQNIRFGIGDIVTVTIFEASSGGLFIPAEAGVRPGNFINIPNQAVDVNGNISIPYAGSIRARGRTPVEVQQAIVDALKNRAIEPQAVVSLIDQRTSMINVITEGKAVRLPAMATPERILDTLSRAGGFAGGSAATSGAEMWVMLERNRRRELAPFGALVYEPVNNVYIHPDDTIYIYREPQTFLAFGAFGGQQQIPFGAWRISLAEAISKAGGLADSQADPAAVFLYRGETRDVATAMGIDCAPFEGPIIPVIYNINLRDPAGLFLAKSFEMRNKDVIYVSNSFSVESTKFMNYLATIHTTIRDPMQTALTAYTLKAAVAGTSTPAAIITTPSQVIPTVVAPASPFN